jgi:hypothetical protein
MKRKKFLKTAAIGASAFMANPWISSAEKPQIVNPKNNLLPLAKLKKPLAMAMWDFSWILRHHRYGEFEDWDKVLYELAKRGYEEETSVCAARGCGR